MSRKQDWIDAMGVPPERAFTYDMEVCPDELPCACEACRSYAAEEGESAE